MKSSAIITLCSAMLLTACNSQEANIAQGQAKQGLKIVSWNIEHLAANLDSGCKPRSAQDYQALATYAASLDADIVALQEVESAAALARVFPADQWSYVVSKRADSKPYECRGKDGLWSTPQRTAFAVRKSVPFTAQPQFKQLALGNPGLRYGISIKLDEHPSQLEIMNVHLKSGCFIDDHRSSDKKACTMFSQQAPVLENWVNQKLNNKQALVLLGDFNHRLTTNNNHFWQVLSREHSQTLLTSSMSQLQSCHPRFKDPIDHIVYGPITQSYVITGSEQVDHFGQAAGSLDYADMLSDHCPISIEITH